MTTFDLSEVNIDDILNENYLGPRHKEFIDQELQNLEKECKLTQIALSASDFYDIENEVSENANVVEDNETETINETYGNLSNNVIINDSSILTEKDINKLNEIKNNNEIAVTTADSSENIIMLDTENTKQILELVELYKNQNKGNEFNDDIIVIDTTDGENNYSIQCSNCDEIFTLENFEEHICEYDDNKDFIKDMDSSEIFNIDNIKTENDEENLELKCLNLLSDNHTRLIKMLKDELNYDVSNRTSSMLSKPIDSVEKLVSTKSKGPHGCSMCDRKFVHASGLARHLEKHESDFIPSALNDIEMKRDSFKTVIKCIICNLLFSNVNESINHLMIDHENITESIVEHDMSEDDEEINDAIQCLKAINNTNAEYYSSITNNYTEYFKCIILRSVLQCEYCDLIFTDIKSLLKHESVHDPARGYQCTNCEIYVDVIKDILIHWQIECPKNYYGQKKNINLQTYFVCNVCQNKFSTLDQLYVHRHSAYHFFPRFNNSTKKLHVNCEICGQLFVNAKSLILHYQERHKKKIIKKEGTTKYRQYLCDVCGKSYTQSSHLWQHLRFHKGVKPFACQELNCGRRFTIRPDLNDHIRKCHTGERPYHCLICGKRFLTGSVFYQHRLIHRGERRYGCDECGKRFYRADALKNHQRIHTGEKPYACSFCVKCFRQRGDRDKHIRARHSNCTIIMDSKDKINNKYHSKFDIRKKSNNIGSDSSVGNKFSITNNKKNKNIVYVGNVPFPTSMFKPIIKDIDAIE